MNLNRNVFYVSFSIAILSIISSIVILFFIGSTDSDWISFINNITIGLFTSSIVTSFISITSYFKEKNNLNKKYYVISSKLLQNTMNVIEYVEMNKKPDESYRESVSEVNDISSELMYLFNSEKYFFKKSEYSKFAESALDRTINIFKSIEKMIHSEVEFKESFQKYISTEAKKSINELIEIHKTRLLQPSDDYTLKDYYQS